MLFSSVTFLFFFLPITLMLHQLAPWRWKNHVLLAASVIFYASGEPRYIALLALSAGGGGPVSTFSGSYAAIVGRCALGRYGAAASRSSPLEALAGLDGEYLQTLRLYLQLFRRPAAVAEAEGLHRNTVINRIRKVEELLHADLSDAETASALQLGLELAELSDAERRGANG